MASVRSVFYKAIISIGITRYSDTMVRFIITMILARLLRPETFGVIAILLVFIGFLEAAAQTGFTSAIIQYKGMTAKETSSIFWFCVSLGFVLSLCLILLSESIGGFFGKEDLSRLIPWLACTIPLRSGAAIHFSLLRKEKRFFTLGGISVLANLLSGIFAIILAALGFGVFALVFHHLASAFFLFSFYLLASNFRTHLHFRIRDLKPYWRFALNQFAGTAVEFFYRNLDRLFLGKQFDAQIVGFYDRAYSLLRLPINNLTYVFTPALHPIMSDYQNDKTYIRDVFLKMSEILSLCGISLVFFMHLEANDIILLVYGPQWRDSVPLFRILCFIGALELLKATQRSVFQSIARTDLFFLSSLLFLVCAALGLLTGYHFWGSISAVVWGFSVAYAVAFLASSLVLFRALGSGFLRFLAILTKAFGLGTSQYLLALLLRNITQRFELAIVRLLLQGIIWLFLWWAFLGIFSKNTQKEFHKIFKWIWENAKTNIRERE